MKIFSALVFAGFVNSFAVGWGEIGSIQEIRIDPNTNQVKVYGTVKPDCSESYLWWNLTETGAKDFLSMAVTAQTSNMKLSGWLTGAAATGNCHVNMIALTNP